MPRFAANLSLLYPELPFPQRIGAAEARGLACHVHRERDLSAAAAKKLNKPEPAIRRTLAAIGRGIDGGWRAEQKAAALSAWMLL